MRSMIFLVAAACSGLTSCTVLQKTETVRTTPIYGPGVLQYPVLVDLDVRNTKVTASAGGYSSSLQSVKNQAISNAVKSAGADVLVEPVFDVQYKGSRITVNVSGYPATYKNFRPVTQADLPMLETGILQTARVAEATVAPPRKKSPAAGIIVAMLVLGGLVVALGGGGN